MGDGHGGKIRGRAGWTDGGRGDRNNKKDVVSVGGGGSGHVQYSQLEQTNGRETDSVVSNGREARCALDVSLHLSFSKCCFVCSPLNKPPAPQKRKPRFICCCT